MLNDDDDDDDNDNDNDNNNDNNNNNNNCLFTAEKEMKRLTLSRCRNKSSFALWGHFTTDFYYYKSPTLHKKANPWSILAVAVNTDIITQMAYLARRWLRPFKGLYCTVQKM